MKNYVFCRNCKSEDELQYRPKVCGACGSHNINIGTENIIRFRVYCCGESTDGEDVSYITDIQANSYEDAYNEAMHQYEDAYKAIYMGYV